MSKARYIVVGLVATIMLVGVGAFGWRDVADRAAQGCVDAWNQPIVGSQAPTSPAAVLGETSFGAKLGFISQHVLVESRGRCMLTFDLGDGWTYQMASFGSTEPPTVESWGSYNDVPQWQAHVAWNACQQPDGTLRLDTDACPASNARSSQPIMRALEQANVLRLQQQLRDTEQGGVWWLGARYRGAFPTRAVENPHAIAYSFPADGQLFRVLITLGPPTGDAAHWSLAANHCTPGTGTPILLRCQERATTVVVTRSEIVPGGPSVASLPGAVRDDIAATLRPVEPEATRLLAPATPDIPDARIDPTAPHRPLGFGRLDAGLAAHILTSTPAGVSVVRYGSTGGKHTFDIVTYTPVPYDCSISACHTPRKLVRRYGRPVTSWIIGHGWLVTMFTRNPTLTSGEALGRLELDPPRPLD